MNTSFILNTLSRTLSHSVKNKKFIFFHELNQKIYIQLMYNTISINFSVFCNGNIQIESVKKNGQSERQTQRRTEKNPKFLRTA